MKYLTIFFSIFIFACERCNEMTIDHDLQKTFTETFIRTVGATERTGVRGTLPQPSPNDTNVIHLATNGNDGTATGTAALPFLTLNAAIVALTGPKPTIHIFRNSATGDLIFNETVVSTLGVGYNIQSEDGEIGYIVYSLPASTGIKLTLSGTNKLNGLYVIDEYMNPSISGFATIWCNSSTLTFNIENCTIWEDRKLIVGGSSPSSGACIGSNTNTGLVTIKYCVLINYVGIITSNATLMDLDNNIYINNIDSSVDSQNIFTSGGVVIYTTNTASQNLSIDRCLFSNFIGGVNDSTAGNATYYPPPINLLGYTSGTNPGQQTITINSSHAYNCDSLVLVSEVFATGNNKADITFNNDVYAQTIPVITTAASMPANITWTVNDKVTPSAILFHNELLFLNDSDIESSRLQREGQTTPDDSGKYYLTSPLVGAGLSGDDITPFDESVAYVSMAFNKTLDINWPPHLFNFGILHQNPVNLRNVKGNLQRTFDTKRRSFGFQWGDGEHISNIQVKQLGLMIADNGSKKLFPMGRNVNIFEEDISSTGIFSSTDNSLNPTMAASVPMVTDWWAGLWVNIAGDEFYIESNDETKLYLLDKLDLGFPSNGLQTFIIDSVLVNTEAIKYLIKQTNFTSFRDGGFLREDYDNNVRAFDYTIETITLEEIEDIEENV